EADEIERARKERAKYAGNDDINDDDWPKPGQREGWVEGQHNSEGSSPSQLQLNTSGASSTTRAETSAFSFGSQYESDSDPDNDLGDLPSDPDENEELKRLAGRILRVHMSSLNSYSRFGRRPQRKKPSSLGTTDQQTRSKPAASPKKKDKRSAPEKVLTTVMNASSEDAPWETVFMTEVADNKNLKESV
ncbi:AP-3 complex subunit mu-2, partial [Perkinsus olseni]